jgi:hypothetical protein
MLVFEDVDLARGGLAERGVQGVATVELRGVHEERQGAAPEAAVLLVAEERQVPWHDDPGAIVEDLLPARHPVEDELGDGGVRADHDEDRRGARGGLRPGLVAARVVGVERVERALQGFRDDRLAVDGRVLDALPGQVVAHPQPEVTVGGAGARRGVIRDRHPGDLDDRRPRGLMRFFSRGRSAPEPTGDFWTWWTAGRHRVAQAIADGGCDARLVEEINGAVKTMHPGMAWELAAGRTARHASRIWATSRRS